MFKKVVNSMITLALSFIFLSSWDLVWSGNSLLLFGEPQYPIEK